MEYISSCILSKLKDAVLDRLGPGEVNAVITVPAYFDSSQREATKDAGEMAGLKVIRIINEPTAAALAYGLQNVTKNNFNLLVFDLGGGTFDVSVVTIVDSKFNVRASCGDSHLGGEDFDRQLFNYFVEKIKEDEGIDFN